MKTFWTFFYLLGLTTIAFCSGNSVVTYQKGTISINPSDADKSCKVQFQGGAYLIGKCGAFKDGQTVEYREAQDTLYLRADGAKESKHKIEAKERQSDPEKAIVWLRGTVQGYNIRRPVRNNNSNNSSLNITLGGGKIKVYELHGAEAKYLIDLCGSFQAGKFSPGQEVDYRVDGERLYIRHDGDKEYSCQIEGKSLPDSSNAGENVNSELKSGSAPQNR